MELPLYLCTAKSNLHSNMDLLKSIFAAFLTLATPIYIPIWIYSNGQKMGMDNPRNGFTFQYGSTQIYYIAIPYRNTAIYIPIWIYSNITAIGNFKVAMLYLHSNMDLLK